MTLVDRHAPEDTRPTVLVVREPDSYTVIEVSPPNSVRIVEADLGSSFDGHPDHDDPEEMAVAREIVRHLINDTAHLPDTDELRQSAISWAEGLLPRYTHKLLTASKGTP
jgi:hypothetical protein